MPDARAARSNRGSARFFSEAGRAPARLAAWAGIALAVAFGVGCSGHGTYTKARLEEQQEKMSLMRSGTEYDMSRQAFFAGDLDKALKRVDTSIGLNSTVPKSHVLRGRIQIERGDLDSAKESLLRAEALEPENVDAQYYLGIVFERFTEKETALERYTRAAELDPSAPQHAVAAAEMMMDLGRLDEAEEYLLTRKSSFEHFAGVRQTLGHIEMLRGNAVEAAELFNEARLLAPDDKAIVEDLIRAQIAVGRFAEAEYNAAQLLKAAGNQGRRDLQHVRALCLMEVDRPVEAREVLLALTGDGAGAGDVRAWQELGNVAYLLKDMNRLRLASTRLIALTPDRSEGYVLRALWQRRHGDLPGAMSSLDKAIVRRGTDTAPLVIRGAVQKEMGRLDAARATFTAVLKEDPKNQAAALMLATTDAQAAVATVGQD